MGKPQVTSRRGKTGVYWRDVLGRRHFVVSEDACKRAELLASLEAAAVPGATTVGQYASIWLERVEARSSAPTLANYKSIVHKHIAKTEIGHAKLVELRRGQCKAWVVAQLATGAAPCTVGLRIKVLRALLQEAREDELIAVNPAASLIRAMRISMTSREAPGIEASAAVRLLDLARELDAPNGLKRYRGLYLMIHVGLRVGEATGLRWVNVDLHAREASIVEQMWPSGEIAPVKTKKSRRVVQIPSTCADEMRGWRVDQQAEALAAGKPATEFVLGIEPEESKVGRNRMRKLLYKSSVGVGLPRLKLHDLRHTFASLHLSSGEELKWVQEQMGHSRITTTADLYGSHLRRRNSAAADNLGQALKSAQMGLWKKR